MTGARGHRWLWPVAAAAVALLALAAWPAPARAYDARLAWSPARGAVGYRVYLRESAGAFGAGLEIGRLTPDADGLLRFALTGLALGVDYRVAVAAYGAAGRESPRSNELPVALALAWTPTATATPTLTRRATEPPAETATRAAATATATLAPTRTDPASPSPTPTATPLPTWRVELGGGVQVPRGGSAALPVTVSGGTTLRRLALRVRFDPTVVALTGAQLRLVAGVGRIALSTPTAGVADVVVTLEAPFTAAGALFDLTVAGIGACRATSALRVETCAVGDDGAACAASDGELAVRCGVAGRIRHWASDAPVTGAQVQLSADSAMIQTTTDALGQFGFAAAAPAGGTWRLLPEKRGGLGGAVSALDAALVLRAAAGLGTLDEMQRLACDVTGNGALTALDAARILQLSVGASAHLPLAETCGSDWTFVPDAGAVTGAQLIVPAPDETTCQQGAVDLDLSTGDPPPQEFLAVPLGDCTGNWAPAGTGAVRRLGAARAWLQAPRPRRGGGWLVALRVGGGVDFAAIDARLTALDGDAPPPLLHAVGSARGAATALHAGADGRLAFAIASPTMRAADGRPVAVLIWRGRAAPRLRLDAVALDEQPIRVR